MFSSPLLISEFEGIKFVSVNFCILCERKDGLQHLTTAYDTESKSGEYEILLCEHCELGMTNPTPTNETLGLLYALKNTSDFDQIRHTFVDRAKGVLAQHLFRRIERKLLNQCPTRILDFGTGNGRFAASAARIYPEAEVIGVDFQESPPPLFKSELCPSNCRYQHMNVFLRSETKFDVIILRHVLEHTPNPVKLVEILQRCLVEGGVLYIEVPNIYSAGTRDHFHPSIWASLFGGHCPV